MKDLIFGFLIIAMSFQVIGADQANPETLKLLEKMVSELNKNTPRQLSSTQQLERFSTQMGELTYHYKSSQSDVRTFAIDRFMKDRTRELTDKVCNEPSQKFFRDHKVNVNYKYLDKNDKLLATISINAGECI